MTHYSFHLIFHNQDIVAPLPAKLDDVQQAWKVARSMAWKLLAERPFGLNWLACLFEVRDGSGQLVFELPFADVAHLQARLH